MALSNPVIGRHVELGAVARFIASITDGASAFLVEGEPGIGKTTIWLAGIEQASSRGLRVVTSRPAEAESDLTFCALGDLLESELDSMLPGLPAPRARALEAALHRADAYGPGPDPLAVSLAVLDALRWLTTSGPLVIAIDDVQWLDVSSAKAISFALRRLLDAPIGLLAALRVAPGVRDPFDLDRSAFGERWQRLQALPLPLEATARLMNERLSRAVPWPTARRIHEVTGGNPFFSLEIGRAVLDSGFSLEPGAALPVPDDVHTLLGSRLATLGRASREALLVAAILSRPSVRAVSAALARPCELDLAEAEKAGVLERSDGRIRFTHPLLSSAVSELASPEELRGAHRSIAAIVTEPEERARHLALAAEAPDADVADALDAAAETARARGAPDRAGELSELAVRLTPAHDQEGLRRRSIGAAEHHFQAGDRLRARDLLESLLNEAAAGPGRAEILVRLAFHAGGDVRASRQLLADALAEAPEEPRLLVEIHIRTAWVEFAGGDLRRAAAEARDALVLAESLGDMALLGGALTTVAFVEHLRGRDEQELMTRALSIQESDEEAFPLWGISPRSTAGLIGWLHGGRDLLELEDRLMSERGFEQTRVKALCYRVGPELIRGDWDRAQELADEAYEIARGAGMEIQLLYMRSLMAALTGCVDEARSLAERGFGLARDCGNRLEELHFRGVLGFIELSLGNPPEAYRFLEGLADAVQEMGCERLDAFSTFPFIPDEIESLVALGRTDDAALLARRLDDDASRTGESLIRMVAHRCRGLIAAAAGDQRKALSEFERAIMASEDPGSAPFELGRTLLVLGTAQRRFKQRKDARGSLEAAIAIFDRLGAPLWSERARAELARVIGRSGGGELTDTERRIAELVAKGLTNREVAEATFLSVKTVEANLSRVFHKLGIHSRREISRRLA